MRRLRGIAALLALAFAGTSLAMAQTMLFGVGDAQMIGKTRALLSATFNSPGTASIVDIRAVRPGYTCGPSPRIKKRTITVAAAGTNSLPVITFGRARSKLLDGRAVKVVARVTFTPTGGTATSLNKTMVLHAPRKGAAAQSLAHAACSPIRPY